MKNVLFCLFAAFAFNMTAAVTLPYSDRFDSGTLFTVYNEDISAMPSGTQVWTFSNESAIAYAQVDNEDYAATSWLISPQFDLTAATAAKARFLLKVRSSSWWSINQMEGEMINVMNTVFSVWVREGIDGEWIKQGIMYTFPSSYMPSPIGYVYMDLSAFAGKVIQIGFKYDSRSNVYSNFWPTFSLKWFDIGETLDPYLDMTIGEARAMHEWQRVNLNIDSAQVVYVDTSEGHTDAYVREGDAAILVSDIGFDLPVNSMLCGSLKGGMAFMAPRRRFGCAFTPNEDTNAELLAITEGTTAQPRPIEISEVGNNENDLVTISDVTIKAIDGNTNIEYRWDGHATHYFAYNSTGDSVGINNKFHLLESIPTDVNTSYVIKGIVAHDDGLLPTEEGYYLVTSGIIITEISQYSGVEEVIYQRPDDGRYYDLTGRPVADPAAPGIYIHNGKKVLVH